MAEACCENPTIHTEHLALRWGDGYTCFGGMFPTEVCTCCGEVVSRYGWLKEVLFTLMQLITGPWDGAMCTGHDNDAH